MNLTVIVVWMITIVIDTIGQLAFKAAASENTQHNGIAHWKAMAMRPWIWVGIASYIIEFITWLVFLSLVPLSDGVMLGSINIVVILIAGRLFFNEKLTPNRLIGVILISLGVTVVGLGT
ncbi:EamA family transporter [Acinetobacter sp.]|uniref:4-amino-4-deoxy-L-arabinose-phosphoundecaprenol flippase subunit ArnE n=1 Tax=Acinetobacter bereziniae TaxID=106648 RepID=A0A833PH92_ACIBZ|nr:EamA family transporter [Acinetobacter sp.]KAF1026973.1 MAG: 4-amino-4-deoxy-L-arabinose-phosphoundecaprenol flippase subunit ArnE [Acinetobacter bereziniae]MDR0235797.1 EamA family transporter [Acinetobacter sp.]